jgi:hypothetical protein
MFGRKETFEEKRGAVRRRINIKATLQQPDRSADCVVRNISSTGVQLIVRTPPPPETSIAVKMDRVGFLQAIVRWRDGNRLGAVLSKVTAAIEERIRKL